VRAWNALALGTRRGMEPERVIRTWSDERFGSLIGDREPVILHKEIPGMGRAKRYIITIVDDDRARWISFARR
jgi:hypothetical protein